MASPLPATALEVGAAVVEGSVFDVDELLLSGVFVADPDADDELSVCVLSAATVAASDEKASTPSNNLFNIVWRISQWMVSIVRDD